MKREKPGHYYEADLHAGGKGSGFKKLNSETGQEDIRMRAIPMESSFARRMGELIDLKNAKKRGSKRA